MGGRTHTWRRRREPVVAPTLNTLAAATWDVIVVGGGNAALVAALSARHHAERVLVLERAPIEFRGGNSRHTRNVRCVHDYSDEFYTGHYTFAELWEDLQGIGTGPSNEELAGLTLSESETIPAWMTDHGIRWQQPLTGTLQLGRTNRFFLGGGKALVNTYYETARRMGVTVAYEAMVEELEISGDRCTGVLVRSGEQTARLQARAVVCASGGFEANIEWLSRYWGDAAHNYIIRGPYYNDGAVLQALYDQGAASAGEERGFHAVAVDARSPRYDGGIATRLDCIPFGIVLNRHAERFYDEGEDLWPKRYAIWGRNIAQQDDQIAYCFWDSKVHGRFLPPMYGTTSAPSVRGVAAALGIDAGQASETIDGYNRAVVPGQLDMTKLDDCTTHGLAIPKSHWAQPLDTPPYYGVAMRPGITFTYKGVAVDHAARVQRSEGGSFANVFAAGEIMSGNILSSGYLAGFGMTIGSVWGRIAGREAAAVAVSGQEASSVALV